MTTSYAPCPRCNANESQKMRFTWWGGLLGPSLLTHVECSKCGMQYNGKTGRSNRNGIIVYSVVLGLITLAVLVGVFGLLVFMRM